MLNKNKTFSYAVRISLAALVLIIIMLLCLSQLAVKRIPLLSYAILTAKIFFSLWIFSSDLSERAKCSWTVFILLFPALAILFYLVFHCKRLTKREKLFMNFISDKKPKKEAFEDKMLLKCKYNLTFLKEIANRSSAEVYSNTDADYYRDAKEMFANLAYDIKRARSFIFLEFYIVASGEAFGNIFKLLKDKAKTGVEVRIIYDGVGSLGRLPSKFISIMESAGIKAVSSPAFSFKLNNRNHRKIVIIDGEIAYTGGINLADEYIYSKTRLGRWKDSAVRLYGEAVNALTYTFLSDFAFLSGKNEDFSKYYKYRKRKCSGQTIAFSDGPFPFYKEKNAKKIIISMLDAAEKYFLITTPYLICDSDILSAVLAASERGVKIRVAIPKKPDKYLVSVLSRRYAEKLARAGAQVYLYTPGFLHSKAYLCDGKFLMLGTVNLDYRSLFHNFENGVLFAEHKIIKDAEEDLNSIFSDSEIYERKRERLPLRLLCSVLEIFAPLL